MGTVALRDEISNMSEDEVAGQARGLATEILQRPGALRDVVSRDWHEVSTGRRRFSHVETQAASLLEVSKQDLLKLVDDHLLSDSRRVLRTRVSAAGPAILRGGLFCVLVLSCGPGRSGRTTGRPR